MSELLYKCLTKATDRETGAPRSSHNWVISKRAFFKIYVDHIQCGSWIFPQSEISDVILYRTKSLLPVRMLKFNYKDKIYQFGFNPWAKPEKYLNCPFTEEKTKLGYSTFSIILRIVLLVYLGWYIWEKFLK